MAFFRGIFTVPLQARGKYKGRKGEQPGEKWIGFRGSISGLGRALAMKGCEEWIRKEGKEARKQSLSFFAQGDRLIKRSPSLPQQSDTIEKKIEWCPRARGFYFHRSRSVCVGGGATERGSALFFFGLAASKHQHATGNIVFHLLCPRLCMLADCHSLV